MPKATATAWIAGVTAAAWAVVASLGWTAYAAISGGFIPLRLTEDVDVPGLLPALVTPFTSVLLHANLLHVGLNLMMLLICGTAVERAIGAKGLLILYVSGAIAAAAAHWGADPQSQVPVIGASGAISAIVGGYALLFGKNKVRSANPAMAKAIHIAWLAASWIGLQLLLGFATSGSGGPSIAVVAHIGGFLAGLALVRPLLRLQWRNA